MGLAEWAANRQWGSEKRLSLDRNREKGRGLTGGERREKMEKRETLFGVVVLNRGSAYVGDVAVENGWCVITNARRIQFWGAAIEAQCQLAVLGPQQDTELQTIGTVRVPVQAIVSIFDTEVEKWRRG